MTVVLQYTTVVLTAYCCIIQVTVNPTQSVSESDYNNNVARCDVTYSGTAVEVSDCRLAP